MGLPASRAPMSTNRTASHASGSSSACSSAAATPLHQNASYARPDFSRRACRSPPRLIRLNCQRASARVSTGRAQYYADDHAGGSIEALVEVIVPPPHLWIFGVGRDAVSILALARTMGWTLSICGRRARWQTRERFASADHLYLGPLEEAAAACAACEQSFALVMSHDYEQDRETLGILLSTQVRYIEVLGPRQRTLRLLSDLKRTGWVPTQADAQRLHAPVGLDLGAETSQEIALAVLIRSWATTHDETK